MSALTHLPGPLLNDIVRGRTVPIVGAGFSRNAVLPQGLTMPLWSDLGELLGRQTSGYPADEPRPIEGVSAYEWEFGRAKLVEELRAVLHHRVARPGPVHRAFCRLPFDIVCTTNIDCLLERAYDEVSRPCDAVLDEEQLALARGSDAVTLVKLHGDVDHPRRLVVSEADYDGFLTANQLLVTYLSGLLISRTALFIGYSLDDTDFRQILAAVTTRLGAFRRPAYVLTFGCPPYERARFERRGIRCIDLR